MDAQHAYASRPELQNRFRSGKPDAAPPKKIVRIKLVLSVTAAALIAAALLVSLRNTWRWNDFIRELQAQPGIVVTSAERPWFAQPHVHGLRDADASADVEEIARGAGVDPDRTRFNWEEFLSVDAASVKRRFVQRFTIPAGTIVRVRDGVVAISGAVPYEWLEQVKREATLVAGVRTVIADTAVPQYDPQLAQQRFERQFGLPDGVTATVNEGVLKLSGEASRRWLTRVRATAATLPGIREIDDRAVIDLDERAFQQSKTLLEAAFVSFVATKDAIAPEGFAALARIPEELRRCVTAATNLERHMVLQIRGYADSAGGESLNLDLSRRRAERVREFLIEAGFDAAVLNAVPMGSRATPAAGAEPLPEDANRRVDFSVVSFPMKR
jgi:outer membrane protein OmpA-like peptidoglycan-associated protein